MRVLYELKVHSRVLSYPSRGRERRNFSPAPLDGAGQREGQIAVVIFTENLNGPFSGRGAADVHAGLDIKAGVLVGFLPGMAQDAGKQAHRRFEDQCPALIINACLLLLYCCRPVLAYRSFFRPILLPTQGVRVRKNVKHLSGPLTRCFYCTTISKRALMLAFAALE
jgi:hypothetical protein